MARNELQALDQHKLIYPSVSSYHLASTLCHEEPPRGHTFLCACRASLALRGNTRSVVGMQMAPAWLCSWERFRVHDHPELKRWDVLVEEQSQQKAFLLGRWAEAAAQDGLPRRGFACSRCWTYCTSPRSTLSCLSTPFHFYKNRKLLRVQRATACIFYTHATQQGYFTGGDCEFLSRWMSLMFHTYLQQVALIKLLQKKGLVEKNPLGFFFF